MSSFKRRTEKQRRYNEDGLRVRREEPHMRRVHEKHIKNALRAPHLVDYLAEEEDEY